MSYRNTLKREILSVLEDLSLEHKDWKASLVTTLICENHADEIPEDAEFSRFAIYSFVRREVRLTINKLAGDKPEQKELQLLIPGYKMLQTHYVVEREGESIGVHIDNMTSEEIQEKIKRYECMATSCKQHAEELRVYDAIREVTQMPVQ